MTDFAEAIKLLQSLGLIQIFSIPIGFLLFAYLFKRFLLNGSMVTFARIGSFLKETLAEILANEKERIKIQTSVDIHLLELSRKFEEISQVTDGHKQTINESIGTLRNELKEHITEIRNILLSEKRGEQRPGDDKV